MQQSDEVFVGPLAMDMGVSKNRPQHSKALVIRTPQKPIYRSSQICLEGNLVQLPVTGPLQVPDAAVPPPVASLDERAIASADSHGMR